MTRDQRIIELRELHRACPERLVALYRSASHLGERDDLPRNASFATMAEMIIDHESKVGSLCDASQIKHELSSGEVTT